MSFPLLIHFAQTRIFFIFLSMTTCFDWRLGKNFRLVIPVVFLPTPPFFLAKPRRVIEFPVSADFPQISHFLAIARYYTKNMFFVKGI